MACKPMLEVDVFLTATEYAARGLYIPQAWRNLLDQDTLDALDEIRKANEDEYEYNTIIIGQSSISA